MYKQCIKCKGRYWCGRPFCPVYSKSPPIYQIKEIASKEDFSGQSPNIFVGRVGYPNINVGFLSPPGKEEDVWLHDAPRYWAEEKYGIKEIVDLRSVLLNSRVNVNIKNKSNILGKAQLVSQASKPVDVEVKLKDKPKGFLSVRKEVMPVGPTANLKNVRLTENPSISSKVDKVVSDTDLKSVDAMIYLHKKGFDEHFLTKVLSVGNLGLRKNRKLVPTRWSIAASLDAVGKYQIKKIKDFNYKIDYSAYFGSYLGNYYLILFFPEVWGYELFEMYAPKSLWNIDKFQYMSDHEFYEGRKKYAENCGGGYYAARLAVSEKLVDLKKQGNCLVLRFITSDYDTPLGVWVCTEACRNALKNNPLVFDSKEKMLEYVKGFIKTYFKLDVSGIFKESKVLNYVRFQKKLLDY